MWKVSSTATGCGNSYVLCHTFLFLSLENSFALPFIRVCEKYLLSNRRKLIVNINYIKI